MRPLRGAGSALSLLALLLGGAGGCGPERVPPVVKPMPHRHPSHTFAIREVWPHIRFQNPTSATMPPGRRDVWFVTEREGRVLRVEHTPQARDKQVVLDLRRHTLGWQDVGLLNLVFHPEFGRPESTNRGAFYLWYNHTPSPHPGPDPPFHGSQSVTRLSRFTIPDGSSLADPDSELVLIEQRRTNTDHMGGGMFFHPRDGFLYLGVGDGGTSYLDRPGGGFELRETDDPQRLDRDLLSGVLRIDVDARSERSRPIRRQPLNGRTAHYAIPLDNPWSDRSGGRLEEFFAIGFRNPHRMSYDAGSDCIYLGDVGSRIDEVDVVVAGGNYGWNHRDGDRPHRAPPTDPPGRPREPLYAYRGSEFPAVIGGHVYRGRAHPELVGRYVFGENGSGQVWALDPEKPAPLTEVLRLPGQMRTYSGLSSFAVDGEQELYLCILGDNERATGSLQKLVQVDRPDRVPATLSAVGLFSDTAALKPAPGLVPYQINVPFWSDHASKQRWLSLPAGSRLGFRPTGAWSFPPGTVAVKHFDLAVDERDPQLKRRLETRVLALEADGRLAGRTYRWRADGQDADLVEEPTFEHLTAVSAAPFLKSGGSSADPLLSQVTEMGDLDLAGRWDRLDTTSGWTVRRTGSPAAPRASVYWEPETWWRRRQLVIETAVQNKSRRTVVSPASGAWLRLARTGNQLRFYAGEDGVRWTLLAERPWLGGPALVGPFARDTGRASVSQLRRCLPRDHVYPEPNQCGDCHLDPANPFLGINTRQWNREVPGPHGQTINQLVLASTAGLLDADFSAGQASTLGRLVAPTDPSAPLEERVRSYLDANCSHCHRPGVVTPMVFDARHDVPLSQQRLIWGRSRWPAVPRPRDFIVKPGDPSRSELHQRVAQGTMPPVGLAMVDREAADLLASWILGQEPRNGP